MEQEEQVASSEANILVVDDTPANLKLLSTALSDRGYAVRPAPSGALALAGVQSFTPDLILLDVNMPQMDGYELCRHFKSEPRTREVPIIFISALHETLDKVRAFQVGGVDYITKPFEFEEVVARVETHLTLRRLRKELQEQNALKDKLNETLSAEIQARRSTESALQSATLHKDYLQEEIKSEYNFEEIIGTSSALELVLEQVAKVAETDSTVLILGESGTGKELIARALHDASLRRERPLVKVNCAAVPSNLFESELFGHERGSFTGATRQRVGRFELANGGTIFLDEIGELPEDVQAKLLRVLQEREFERVGGSTTIRVDARICAATNRDLEEDVRAGRFREDLYYRLNVFPIQVPPLRERLEDIPILAQHFIGKLQKKLRKGPTALAPSSVETLQRYAWPGNVRELLSVIERAMIVSTTPELHIGDDQLPRFDAAAIGGGAAREAGNAARSPVLDAARPVTRMDDMIRRQILAALAESRGTIEGPNGAAGALEIHPGTLRSRIRKLSIPSGEWVEVVKREPTLFGIRGEDGTLLPLDGAEAHHIQSILSETDGRIDGRNGAAVRLGLHPSTLRSRIKKLAALR